jgi:hypothetical protein
MDTKTKSNRAKSIMNRTKKIKLKVKEPKVSHTKTAIIIPFRDDKEKNRSKQLKQFISYMTNYLQNKGTYHIFIIEQSDDGRKFNRGKLLNIGYKVAESKQKFTHYIFHDVDLLPSDDLLPYYVNGDNTIVHIAKVWKRYNNQKYFGGVVSFPKDKFEKINGFPNNFWGWGGEDDELYLRVQTTAGMEITYPKSGSFTDLENKNLAEKMQYLRNEKELKCLNKKELLTEHRVPPHKNGLSTLHFVEENRMEKSNYMKVTVDVLENDHWTDSVCGVKNVTEGAPTKAKSSNKYDISDFKFSYRNIEDCKQGPKLPFMIDPKEFINLLPKRLVLNKPVKEEKALKELEFDIYKNLNRQAIVDTFNYLFHHIRMGIFVYIKNNKLQYFIPFQKMDYKNNWSSKIKFKNNMTFDEYYEEKMKYTGKTDNIEKDLSKWSSNNCLIGNWTDNEVGDMGWYEIRDMLHQTCNNHKVNDCVFFINRRDHPVLTPNKMEPYFHIFDNINTPLSEHKYDKYVPIMSFSKNKNFADLLIPNYADWRNVTKQLYPTGCIDMEKDNINKEWETKLAKAIFRGSATGCGVTPEDNQRINLAKLSKEFSSNEKTKNLMDAGLVGKNLRDKKNMNKEVDFFRYKDYDLQYSERKSMNEQSNYKYIIHIDGHVSAYRLGKEMSLGSTLLKVDSLHNYKMWFSNHMVQGKHYLSIKKDLSNLKDAINWCKKNDTECKVIGENADKLYKKVLNKKFILGYFAWMINSISHNYTI